MTRISPNEGSILVNNSGIAPSVDSQVHPTSERPYGRVIAKVRHALRQHPGATSRDLWQRVDGYVDPQRVSNELQRLRRRGLAIATPAGDAQYPHRMRWWPV